MTLLAECCLVYLAFVFAAVTLLWFFPFNFIDIEELVYGTFPIALIDGEVELHSILDFQEMPREGSELVLGFPIALLFRLFGPTLFTLKFASILLSGVWAAVWYYIARSCYGSLPRVYLGALFAIPFPLVQFAILSTTYIMTHLGSSLWHGIGLLLLCQWATAKPCEGNRYFFFSGFVCGVGIYCGYSVAPLVPGVFWLAWRLGGTRAAVFWFAGLVPTLPLTMAMFQVEPLTRIATEGSGSFYLPILIKKLMLYGAGYVTLPSGDGPPYYSELSVIYSVGLIVLGMIYAYRFSRDTRSSVTVSQRLMYESLGISALGYFFALLVTEYELEPNIFDGLRYLIPLGPMVVFLFLEGVKVLQIHHARIAFQCFLVCNLVGWMLIAYPFSPATHLSEVKGYTYHKFRNILKDVPLNDFYFSEVRQYQKAFGAGLARSERNGFSASWADYETSLEGTHYAPRAIEEYWRGVGYALTNSGRCMSEKTCTLNGAPKEVKKLNWQGAAFLLPCVSNLTDMIEETAVEFHEDIVRGLARGAKWDTECSEGLPDFVTLHPRYEQWVQDGWILDFSPHLPTQFYKQGKFEKLWLYGKFYHFSVDGTWGNVPGSDLIR